MQPTGEGVFEALVENAGHGTDYMFVLDGRTKRPDPCSRSQPHGVHGPSRVFAAHAFTCRMGIFRGVDLRSLVLYELARRDVTPEGTYEGVIAKLPYLADLGVTAIELMPVAQFPGDRNWGYDGVFPYAAQASYGGPEGLQKLVDASHRHGIAVRARRRLQPSRPEGNYLGDYGPYSPIGTRRLGGKPSTSTPRLGPGATLLPRQRAQLADRFPRRHPASRCHSLDLRHERAALSARNRRCVP